MANTRILLLIIVLLFINISLGCATNNDVTERKQELHVAAASNLVQVFTELGQQFEEEHPIELVFSFGSSGQLSDQIINGAPYDMFTPANIEFLDQLVNEGLLLEENYTTYAFGTIGFSTLKESDLQVDTFEDLLNDDIVKIAIANPEHAPYGMAAKQALEEAAVWEKVEEKLVYGRNISDTLALLQTKNVEVAMIALSLKDEETLTFTPINEQLHEPLNHSISILKRSEKQEEAQAFIDFLLSERGQQTLVEYGYSLP